MWGTKEEAAMPGEPLLIREVRAHPLRARLPTVQSEALVNSARDAFLVGFQVAHVTGGLLLVLTAAAFGWATVWKPAPRWRHRPDSAGSE